MRQGSPQAPRRFYKAVGVVRTPSGFGVHLDMRPLRTPAKAGLVTPTRALAQAIAAEWDGQGEHLQPSSMPLTRLANVAIDRAPLTRKEMTAMAAQYGQTDLLSHRAENPPGLVARQAARWDPPLDWAARVLGVRLTPVAGIRAAPQDHSALAQIESIASALDDFALTGLAHATGLTGSVLLALAAAHRAPPVGDGLYEAAALDDLWSQDTWGEDHALTARLANLRAELAALETWFAALAAASEHAYPE